MGKKVIRSGDFSSALEEILKEYGEGVEKAVEEGLKASEKVLKKNLQAASPVASGDFKKKWSGRKVKGSLKRIVGNTKTVPRKGGEIPLSNILEYSTTKGKPFIKRTFDSSVNEMANAAAEEIKKGAK